MPPFCLRTSFKKLPRNLSRAAAGMFIILKISIDLPFAKPFKLFPLVFYLFPWCLTTFERWWNQIIWFSTRVIFVVLAFLYLSLVFFQKTLTNRNLGTSAAECCFSTTIANFSFKCLFFETFWLSKKRTVKHGLLNWLIIAHAPTEGDTIRELIQS